MVSGNTAKPIVDHSFAGHSSPTSPSAKELLLRSIGSLSGLDRVEDLIKSKLRSQAPLLEEIPLYLLTLGGKRMRPVSTLMVAKALQVFEPDQKLIDVAAGIELIHMATLLHDDIIDKSPLRRHRKSPFAKYGVPNTLLSGDFLLVRAFSLCSRLDSFVVDATEDACIDLTEGEILETTLFRSAHTIETSIEIARKKTASLFRLAAKSAAHLAGAGAQATECFGIFGEKLGIAFQIIDDILDVTSDESMMGKQAGIDLRERKPSLVNVLWLKSGSDLSKKLLTKPAGDEELFIEKALAELRDGPVIRQATAIARTFGEEAAHALDQATAFAPRVDQDGMNDLRTIIRFSMERVA